METRADRAADREGIRELVKRIDLADHGIAEGVVMLVADGDAAAQALGEVGFGAQIGGIAGLAPRAGGGRAGAAVTAGAGRLGRGLAGIGVNARRGLGVELLRHRIGPDTIGIDVAGRLLIGFLAPFRAARQRHRAGKGRNGQRIGQVQVGVGFALAQLPEVEGRR